jgi:hypothetical protein
MVHNSTKGYSCEGCLVDFVLRELKPHIAYLSFPIVKHIYSVNCSLGRPDYLHICVYGVLVRVVLIHTANKRVL